MRLTCFFKKTNYKDKMCQYFIFLLLSKNRIKLNIYFPIIMHVISYIMRSRRIHKSNISQNICKVITHYS